MTVKKLPPNFSLRATRLHLSKVLERTNRVYTASKVYNLAFCRQFRNKTFKIFWRTFPKSKRKCRNIYSDGFCNLKKLFIPILKTILNNATKSLSKNIRILSSLFLNIISHPIKESPLFH